MRPRQTKSHTRIGAFLIAETEDYVRCMGWIPKAEYGSDFVRFYRERFAKLGGTIAAIRASVEAGCGSRI